METKNSNETVSTITTFNLQKRLEEELERLKRVLRLGYELEVRWIPNGNSKLSGEVKGDFIYIYDRDEELALETLKHEFIDYAISKVIEPYKEVTNRLIALINENAYQRKEKLVESLCQLIEKEIEHPFDQHISDAKHKD